MFIWIPCVLPMPRIFSIVTNFHIVAIFPYLFSFHSFLVFVQSFIYEGKWIAKMIVFHRKEAIVKQQAKRKTSKGINS